MMKSMMLTLFLVLFTIQHSSGFSADTCEKCVQGGDIFCYYNYTDTQARYFCVSSREECPYGDYDSYLGAALETIETIDECLAYEFAGAGGCAGGVMVGSGKFFIVLITCCVACSIGGIAACIFCRRKNNNRSFAPKVAVHKAPQPMHGEAEIKKVETGVAIPDVSHCMHGDGEIKAEAYPALVF